MTPKPNVNESASAAAQSQQIEAARAAAHRAADEAEKAWHALACLLEVGPDRVHAFEVYENLRCSRRVG